MRPSLPVVTGGVLLLITACSSGGPLVGTDCTAIGPPFGLTFVDMTVLNEPSQPVDGPLVADYCADEVCTGSFVRQFSTDPAVSGGSDMSDAFVFVSDMTAAPTAHLRLHDEVGPLIREVSTLVAARAVTSDVNGPDCSEEGYWGAVRVEPDGSLTDVTAVTSLPESLQPR